MKIFFLFLIIIIAIILLGRNFIFAAKRNLFKDQAAWSGKDIKIKYNTSRQASETEGNQNYLKMIAEESKIYLEDQSAKKEGESK
tara:strand:+ start:1029 stop:1283 length:255 start_codon:yes stop_codon:yes gene_type:complete